MFRQLFRFRNSANRHATQALYEQIVAAARQPRFYSDWDVPDTPLGRYEMLSLHLFLYFHRTRGADRSVQEMAQDVTDMFFTDMDHSLRELGIGDLGVPKRMKKLAKMFYGRVEAYGEAIDAGDIGALAAALNRNVRPDIDGWPEAADLASYTLAASRFLAGLDESVLLRGEIGFVPAQPEQG